MSEKMPRARAIKPNPGAGNRGEAGAEQLMFGRREMLGGLGLLAGTMAGGAPLFAAATRSAAGLIDVHHHIVPPTAPDAVKAALPGWNAERAMAAMDVAGVATAIGFPGAILFGSDADRRRTARAWNEFGARLVQDHPARFGLFATLPFPSVEGSIAEIDFALDEMGACGFGIATSYGEMWLGDQKLWPIYEKLDSRAAVVFVHPYDASCCTPARISYSTTMMDGSWIEWPMNTARAILSLISSGVLRRFPHIRFIFSHDGGLMPLLVERLAGLAVRPGVNQADLKALFPLGVAAEFRTLHFECAQGCSRTNMGALRTLVPDSQILFGSDYPYFPMDYAAGQFARLGLPDRAVTAIARGNALALLPRRKPRPA